MCNKPQSIPTFFSDFGCRHLEAKEREDGLTYNALKGRVDQYSYIVIYACPKGTKLRTCTYHFHYANIIFICPNISFNPNSSKLRKNRQSRVQIRRSRVEIRRSRVEIRRSRVEIRRSRVEIRRSRVEIRRNRVEIRRSRVEIRRSRVEIRRSGS